ncbi:hypothetical protein FYC62_04810 [Pedobacter aquae]|uniref:Uncharacterized protein n=1 Tax=Pedobacter aquae TaxID=2605747 RepID=A0A5C0VIQ1_9SPHI|nr:hypothetical protein [Pedobacter aquae]QEK51070.1 hypothetical protein FYC62_04810 [Pedobacter aquae]
MRKNFLKLLGLVYFLFTGLSSKANEVVIDGSFSEWGTIPINYTNTFYGSTPQVGVQNVELLKTKVTDTHIYFYLEGNSGFTLADNEEFYLFFNTDKNAGTGYSSFAYAPSGADVAFIGNRTAGSVYDFVGTQSTDWSWAFKATFESAMNFSTVLDLGNGKRAIEFSVNRNIFGTVQDYVTFSFYPTADWKAMPEAWNSRSFIQINTPPVTLPVTLVYFKALEVGNLVQLNWSTSLEKNNSHFEIYKSIDGVLFNKIGVVSGNTNSNTIQLYNYADKFPNSGTNYYQLKQVDFDGNSKAYDIITVDTKFKNTWFNVYKPLGSDGIELLIYSSENTDSRFYLLDASGKILINKQINLSQGYQTISLPGNIKSRIVIASLTMASKNITKKILVN